MNGRSNVSLHGNITKDIEPRTTTGGLSVASFTVAINHPKDEVSYIDCVAFGQQADFLSKYCGKGQKVYVQGELKQSKWQDKDGNNRSNLEVLAREVESLSRSVERPLSHTDVVSENYEDEVPTELPYKLDLMSIPF